MELISNIINDLVDNEKSLNSALLKTKVLASRIKNKDLIDWVNKESNGYSSELELPDYRKNIGSHIKGDYIAGNMKYTNQPIPVMGIKENFKSTLTQTNFTNSIIALEALVKETKSSTLMFPFPAEVVGIIEQNWINMGNPYLRLINARKIISTNAISEILVKVRNKLLDFMLEIDSEYGDLTEIKDLSNKTKEISKIMNHTIINNNGDGNVSNTGNNSTINYTNNVTKNNLEQLKSHFKDNGISDEDLKELVDVIDKEKPNEEQQTFSAKVNFWVQNMLGKALDGSWKIAVGSAGTLLTQGLKSYFGI